MRGSDLRCPTCKGEAVDVAPDLDLTPSFRVNMCSIQWRCVNGHTNMIDVAQTDEGEVYVAAEATVGAPRCAVCGCSTLAHEDGCPVVDGGKS